ncbi:MAG: TrmH family RNA methyltransferase [Gemmatimonadales bacterium]
MQLLTLARDLKRRKARERRSQFVAEGVRTVEELLRSRLAVRGVLHTSALAETPRGAALLGDVARRAIESVEVDEKDFVSAADTDHPQGVLAVADVPAYTLGALPLPPGVRMLVLDAVQDPGNAGTLVRTAAALGVTGVIALPRTADLWNAKSVRSGVGAHFRVAAVHASAEELTAWLAAQRITLWGADAGGEAVDEVTAPARLALAVGNEGAGLSAAVRAASAKIVGLPMSAAVESLNVSVAAGIMLWALRA